ncbi:hypothetical protein V2J09_018181 [Rumex salicifolius]
MILGSGLGIILSIVFGCLLLALIAELYYLLWWKKIRVNNTQTSPETDLNTKELFHFFCWNKPTSAAGAARRRRYPNPEADQDPLDVESGPTKDAAVEAELMRLQNRLLFTIKEETKEDLESEDGKSKASRKGSRTRSLSDLILAVDSVSKAPMDTYSRHGFNPLFESSSVLEAELNRIRSSPPPKFKFLRDAEEKLYKRLMEESEKKNWDSEEDELRNGSFIRIIVGKNANFNHHSSSSQER